MSILLINAMVNYLFACLINLWVKDKLSTTNLGSVYIEISRALVYDILAVYSKKCTSLTCLCRSSIHIQIKYK